MPKGLRAKALSVPTIMCKLNDATEVERKRFRPELFGANWSEKRGHLSPIKTNQLHIGVDAVCSWEQAHGFTYTSRTTKSAHNRVDVVNMSG